MLCLAFLNGLWHKCGGCRNGTLFFPAEETRHEGTWLIWYLSHNAFTLENSLFPRSQNCDILSEIPIGRIARKTENNKYAFGGEKALKQNYQEDKNMGMVGTNVDGGEPPMGYAVPIRDENELNCEFDFGAFYITAEQAREAADYLNSLDDNTLMNMYDFAEGNHGRDRYRGISGLAEGRCTDGERGRIHEENVQSEPPSQSALFVGDALLSYSTAS